MWAGKRWRSLLSAPQGRHEHFSLELDDLSFNAPI